MDVSNNTAGEAGKDFFAPLTVDSMLRKEANETSVEFSEKIKKFGKATERVLFKSLDVVVNNADRIAGVSMAVAGFGGLVFGQTTFFTGLIDSNTVTQFYGSATHLQAEIASAGIAASSYLVMGVGKNMLTRRDTTDPQGFDPEKI